MRRSGIAGIFAAALLALWAVLLHGPVYGQGAQAGAAATAAPAAPTDKAAFFPNTDLQMIWKDLESKQVINRRVLEGGAYSINIRIVKEGDAPLVHAKSADVWVTTAGTAMSVTGGELMDPQKRPNADDVAGSSIRGGIERALQAGDILYVPPGVPHGFKNVKGYRGLLIRFDTK
jgi:mannose-6-phosphate isomerase-like protein (cupin superfamily)